MTIILTPRASGRPRNGFIVLAESSVQVANTGSTTENTLATILVPAGTLGSKGILRVTANKTAAGVANANNKTVRYRFGGSIFYSDGFASSLAGIGIATLRNRASNVQYAIGVGGASGTGNSTAAGVLLAIDTTVDQTITITNQLANATDTVTLEGYLVEYLYRD